MNFYMLKSPLLEQTLYVYGSIATALKVAKTHQLGGQFRVRPMDNDDIYWRITLPVDSSVILHCDMWGNTVEVSGCHWRPETYSYDE